MKDLDNHKKIAILIDADNAQHSKLKPIIDELSSHGHIVVKRAYGDWSSEYLKNWKTALNELAIQPIQQFAYTTGKNSTDASMIIDAMDLLYSKKFDAFVLVSSDSDFTKLASRLRESEIFVFGVGERKTPISFRNACDNFIFTEILSANEEHEPSNQGQHSTGENIESLIPVLTKAWEQFKDDDDWANLAPVGNLLKRQMPDYDPRNYGVTKTTEVISKLNSHFEMTKLKMSDSVTIAAFRPK
jgi:uncharacterized protein (TIGR00288 family)